VKPATQPPDPLGLDLRERIAEAYPSFLALGNRTIESRYGRFVVDPENPDVRMANHLQHPRAETAAEVDALLAMMEDVFAHCDHRTVMTDCFTPDGLVARLLADEYRESNATIQMALTGELAEISGPKLDFAPVDDEAAWAELYRLMRADHEEGRRTNNIVLPDKVTRGIIGGLQRKTGAVTFYLAVLAGEPVACGAKVECPNGLGMIEDIFTSPVARNRGIASTLIAHILGRLRTEMPNRPVFLGAHALDRAKHLYRRLGFQPVMVTREFVRSIPLAR
jgi:GNAT superfamily N-acetyltransferase